MKVLLLIFLSLSANAFASPFDYLVKKVNQNKNMEVLENTADHLTLRDRDGLIFTVYRSQVNETFNQILSEKPDSITQGVINSDHNTRLDDLYTQRFISRLKKDSCAAGLAVCGFIVAPLWEFVVPLVLGAACAGVGTDCLDTQGKIIDGLDKQIEEEEKKEKKDTASHAGGGGEKAPSTSPGRSDPTGGLPVTGGGWVTGPRGHVEMHDLPDHEM